MFRKYLLFVVLLFHGALSDGLECIRYDFEDYDNVFPRDVPDLCGNRPWSWNQESYLTSPIASPNEQSKWFIRASPDTTHVCTASFFFTIVPGGIAEANVYFGTTSVSNSLHFRLYQITETGSHIMLGVNTITWGTGWQVMRTTDSNGLTGNPPYRGYIHFAGRTPEGTDMIVDSFRYVPPSMDPENECIMYEDIITTTSTDAPTTTPIPTTTEETTTPTTPTTTPTTPITTPPKNLTNYYVEELVNIKKSVRISKKRITKVGDFDGFKPLGLE